MAASGAKLSDAQHEVVLRRIFGPLCELVSPTGSNAPSIKP